MRWIQLSGSLCLILMIRVPKHSHHVMEPRKIPSTSKNISVVDVAAPPMLAKIPIKLRIVVGLVSVRKKTSAVSLLMFLLLPTVTPAELGFTFSSL